MSDELSRTDAAGKPNRKRSPSFERSRSPDRDGYTFGDEVRPNGDIFDIEVVRDSDSAAVGTARGITRDDIVRQAQQRQPILG